MEAILIGKAFESIGTIVSILLRIKVNSSNNVEVKGIHERLTRITVILNDMGGKYFSHTTVNALKTLLITMEELKTFIEDFEEKNVVKKIVKADSFAEKFTSFNNELTRLLHELVVCNTLDIKADTTQLAANGKLMAGQLEAMLCKMSLIVDRDNQTELFKVVQLATQNNEKEMNEMKAMLQKLINESKSNPVTIEGLQEIKVAILESSPTLEIEYIRDITINVTEELGSGSFGTVYLGDWQGVSVAVKKLKDIVFKDPGTFKVKSDALTKNKAILKEVKAFEKLQKSPYILRFYGCTSVDGNLGIVTEYMSNQTLSSWLYYDEKLPEEFISKIQIGIAKGLSYMHQNEIAHNDVKSNNIMLDSLFVPRIIDLGMSKITNSTFSTAGKTKAIGTDQWRAPEYWQMAESVQSRKDFPYAGDVYSFGVVLGEIEYKVLPWQDFGSNDIKDAVLAGKRPFLPSPTNLIEFCCKQNPKERPEMTSVVSSLLFLSKTTKHAIIKINPVQSKQIVSAEIKVSVNEAVSFEATQEHNRLMGIEYFQRGKELYDAKEYFKAKILFEKGLFLNNSDTINYLGLMYQNGFGVVQDFTKAKELYNQSGNLGNSDALKNLGDIFRTGQGVIRDFGNAKLKYEESTRLGNSSAMNSLAILYQNGQGVPQDYLKAKKLLEQSVALGNPGAMNNLGMLYESNMGASSDTEEVITENRIKARELYELAATLGNASAMCNLGVMYYKGQGVKMDKKTAKEWFEKSVKLGNKIAPTWLAQFTNK